MRKVPKKKTSNKFVFPFVIILVLVTVFVASLIISYNIMGAGGTNKTNTEDVSEYEQPTDILGGKKTDNDKLKELREENAQLKKQVSDLEVENAELRNELEMITATLENQEFVQQNASSSNNSIDLDTSDTGL